MIVKILYLIGLKDKCDIVSQKVKYKRMKIRAGNVVLWYSTCVDYLNVRPWA